MKKNGFTLIELLAVIVILAIIALIATPIILGIINDAREKANERSVELYASAVKNGIVAYQLREMKEVAAGNYTKDTLPFTVEYDGNVECTSIILSEDSKVSLEGCKVNGGEKEYNYGIEETSSLAGTIGICNPISIQTPGTYTAGDKYECDVDPNKDGYDQIFYVLTTPASGATSVNLIMDSNVRTGGEAVKETNPTDEQKGLVVWITQTDYERDDIGGTAWDEYNDNSSFGPITAIEYLQNATSGWKNVNSQIIDKFMFCAPNVENCISKQMAKTYTMNARLPYLSEISLVGCNSTQGSCPRWMIDFLNDSGYQTTPVSGLNGYWTLSSNTLAYGAAWRVDSSGFYDTLYGIIDITWNGVRPVINLSI